MPSYRHGCIVCSPRSTPPTIAEEGPGNPWLRAIKRTVAAPISSTKQMFSTRRLALTSSLLVAIWFGIALDYYGIIIFNTELQVEDEQCVNDKAQVPSGDYRDVFITTLGEVRFRSRCFITSTSCCAVCCLTSARNGADGWTWCCDSEHAI